MLLGFGSTVNFRIESVRVINELIDVVSLLDNDLVNELLDVVEINRVLHLGAIDDIIEDLLVYLVCL